MPVSVLPSLVLALQALAGTAAPGDSCRTYYEACRQQLIDGRPDLARTCLEGYARECPGAADSDLAAALAQVAKALERAEAERIAVEDQAEAEEDQAEEEGEDEDEDEEAPPEALAEERTVFSVGEFALSGAPELMLASTLFGGLSGFWGSATVLAALRTPQQASLPALLAAPTLGAIGGLAGAIAATWWLEPSPGDAALVTSAMVMGTVHGTLLQFAMFDSPGVAARDPVEERAPWRFATILATSTVATGTAALLAPRLRIDPGDVGLAHSAALWGPVLASLTTATLDVDVWQGTAPLVFIAATSIASYDLTLALSPLLTVPRPATWLVEAGGVLGLLGGVALLPVTTSPGWLIDPVGVIAATTALGVGLGAVGCFALSSYLDRAAPAVAALPLPTLAPLVMPDPHNPDGAPLVGLAVGGRW